MGVISVHFPTFFDISFRRHSVTCMSIENACPSKTYLLGGPSLSCSILQHDINVITTIHHRPGGPEPLRPGPLGRVRPVSGTGRKIAGRPAAGPKTVPRSHSPRPGKPGAPPPHLFM